MQDEQDGKGDPGRFVNSEGKVPGKQAERDGFNHAKIGNAQSGHHENNDCEEQRPVKYFPRQTPVHGQLPKNGLSTSGNQSATAGP